MPVRGRYGHIEGTVRAVPSLPTIGGTGTLRGPVYLRYGLHMRKRAGPVPLPHRAPYFNAYWPHTVLPLPTGTAPVPFCPYSAPTILPPCSPYKPLPTGTAPVPPPYRFASMLPLQPLTNRCRSGTAPIPFSPYHRSVGHVPSPYLSPPCGPGTGPVHFCLFDTYQPYLPMSLFTVRMIHCSLLDASSP